METNKQRRWRLWIGLILAIVTLAGYWRVSQFGFVDFDDQEYVKDNPHVQNGLSADNLRWAFTRVYACNWHPLTWISHMLDCQFFGLNASAQHLINLGLHIVNTLLLLMLLWQMTGATWRSALVAGLFALHPCHVESVAWISERKDVLSTFFALLALLVYVQKVVAARLPAGQSSVGMLRLRDTWLALLFYALSLLSKGMYVTLPFLLLLLDGWPLRRYSPEAPWREQIQRFAQLGREKWPWLMLSFLMSAVTFLVQKTGGAVATISELSFRARLANALIAYVRYVGKMFWPADLTAIYPLPAAWAGWQISLAAVTLVLLSVGAILWLRKQPFIFVGWAWFLGTLVPVIGLVQVGSQALADRYTYFPFVGLFIIVVWLGAGIFSHGRWRMVGAGLSVGLLLACALVTRHQVEYLVRQSRALRAGGGGNARQRAGAMQSGQPVRSGEPLERGGSALCRSRAGSAHRPGFSHLPGRGARPGRRHQRRPGASEPRDHRLSRPCSEETRIRGGLQWHRNRTQRPGRISRRIGRLRESGEPEARKCSLSQQSWGGASTRW
ncbi:MAG: hypothetical protein V9H26_00320 [Verrucomicrobiota bacterium]